MTDLSDQDAGFQQELERLCNKYSIEKGSDTPDFILAQFIVGCLEAWNGAVKRRDEWYGFKPWPRPLLPAPVYPQDNTP